MNIYERVVLYLFIFTIPFQTGLFIWSFPPLDNIFYHQFFIYLSDVLIFSLLTMWLSRVVAERRLKDCDICKAFNANPPLALFIVFSGLGIFFMPAGSLISLAIFRWLKIIEFALLFFYIHYNFQKINKNTISCLIIASAVLQVSIAGAQFYSQESIGLKYLGESQIATNISNVAKIDEGGFKLLRAYGTFPHPNILAMFLVTALLLPYYLYFNNKARIGNNKGIIRHEYGNNRVIIGQKIPLYTPLLFVLILGIFLSFSKIAIVISFLLICLFLTYAYIQNNIAVDRHRIYKASIASALVFLSLCYVFNAEISSRFSEGQSVSQRAFYSEVAQRAISQHPIFGVGIGNFISYMAVEMSGLVDWQYQPAHNLFLLVASETGVIGVILFIMAVLRAILRSFKAIKSDIFGIASFVVLLGLIILANFDHYFWTLQQGQILFWLFLGITSSYRHNKSTSMSSYCM